MTRAKDFDWYKREPKKFIRGARGLGPAFIGAYAMILELIYEDEESCPNDAHWLGGLLGCSGRQARALIDGLIERGKLSLNERGRLVNAKASEVLAAREKTRQKDADTPSTPPRQAIDTASTPPRRARDTQGASRKNKDLQTADKTESKSKIREDSEDPPMSPQEGGAVVVSQKSDIDLAVEIYNHFAALCPDKPNGHGNAGWARSNTKLTDTRRDRLSRIIKTYTLGGWKAAMARAAASDHLSGRSKRDPKYQKWGPDLGWFVKPENFAKLTEGKYDNDRSNPARLTGRDSGRAALVAFVQEAEGKDQG